MATIGVFDSGVGGLSVLAAIREHLPSADLVYVADTAHVPYGPRPLAEVREYSFGITRFLLDAGAEVIVVACNTASAAALHELRAAFPNTPFVGIEPAVKPAAEQSHTGVVAVLATPATFQGALFASVVERFAHGVEVIQQVCPGLVEQIEVGELDTPRTEAMLRLWVEPLLARNIDALVLGCTHYPFVRPLLERICGPHVRVIDPSAAVARQVGRVLSARVADQGASSAKKRPGASAGYIFGEETSKGLVRKQASARSLGRRQLKSDPAGCNCTRDPCGSKLSPGPWDGGSSSDTYYTSGPREGLQSMLGQLGFAPGTVLGAAWHQNQLVADSPTARSPTQAAG